MYYTLAELLQEARAARGLSVHDIEKQTHIRMEYIEALESADYKNLPADVYIRGILKKYSEYLDISYEEMIRLYRKDNVLAGVSDADKQHVISSVKRGWVVLLGKVILGLIGTGALLVIILFIFGQYRIFKSPPSLLIQRPQTEFTESNVEKITLSGSTELEAELFINGQKASLSPKGNFEVSYYLKEGENVIHFVSHSTRNDKETEIIRSITYVPPQEEIAHTLVVEARSVAVWVDIEINDELVFSKNIEAGTSKTFQSSGTLLIKTYDAAHTYLTVDGENTGPMGDESTESELKLE